MTIDWAEWGPPLAVVAFGLIASLAASLRLSQREDAAVRTQGREQDLLQAREAAVEALKSLELDQGKLDPDDYLREREALLTRGASAMRELEAFRSGEASSAPPAAAEPATTTGPAPKPLISPQWQGALTALAAVAIVWGLVQFAQEDAVPRRQGASMTGNQDLGVAPGEAPWKATLEKMQKELEADPNNLGLLNDLTQLSLSTGDLGGAMSYNQRVRAIDPQNPDARVFGGVLAAAVSKYDIAFREIDGVIASHPDNANAWIYKGLILLEQQRPAEAVVALEKAVQLQPDVPPLQNALAQARMMASGGMPPGMMGAPGAQPGGAAPQPAGPAEVVLEGTADLAPDVAATLTGSEILYVSVKAPEGGPPLAALRLPPGPFPVQFKVTTADAISMGGSPRPFPAAVNLSVRIDADGNPMTKNGEPAAELQGVAKGSSGLKLLLQ